MLTSFLRFSTAAELTERHNRKHYVNLSASAVLYIKLKKRCQRFLSDGDVLLPSIASKMLKKLDEYSE